MEGVRLYVAPALIHLPLARADLRRPLAEEALAVDATPSAAGACRAPLPRPLSRALYRRSELRGGHARLDAPPWADETSRLIPRGSDVDAVAACLPWRVSAQYRFREPSHINLQETGAVRNEMRTHCRNHGSFRPQRLLVLSDSRVCIGAVAKGRSTSFKLTGIFRSLTSWLVLGDLSLGMLWVLTKANPADDPYHFVPLRRPTSPPSWASKYFGCVGPPPAPARRTASAGSATT